MSDTLYILYAKGMIEDYYPVSSALGIFSTKEEAEKAISILEVKHRAYGLNRYIDYTNDKTNTREHWEVQKHSAEENLARKQQGSNGWKKAKRDYDEICKVLDTRDFDKIDTFEEWKAKNTWLFSFNRNIYFVKEAKLNSLIKDQCE